jgi:hypothetical protein
VACYVPTTPPVRLVNERQQMRKSRLTPGRACLGVLAAGVLIGAFAVPGVALAGSSCTCNGEQCFTATVSPESTGAGATTTVTFEIENQSSRYPLNSVTITAPTGVEITGDQGSVLPSPVTTVTIGTPASDHSSTLPSGALDLVPGASIPLAVTAILPCVSGSYDWTITATNDGDNDRDDFNLNTSASDLASSVTGSCSLAFVTPGGQPTQTAINEPISSVFQGSAPLEVAVMSNTDPAEVVTDSSAPVTVAIENNPADGTLSGPGTGTTPVYAADGIAQFNGLSINEAGYPYTLEATSPGLSSATSSPFQISSSISPCPTSTCAGTVPTTTGTDSISSTSSGTGDYLAIGAGGISYSCGSSSSTFEPVSFDLLGSDGVALSSAKFTGTFEINAAAAAAAGHPPLWTWQICYASTVEFTALPNTAGTTSIGDVTYYTGLLPHCSRSQQAPCLLCRHKDKAGDEFITFLATGDPVGKPI